MSYHEYPSIRPNLFDRSLPLWRRAFEWFLLCSAISLLLAMLMLVFTIVVALSGAGFDRLPRAAGPSFSPFEAALFLGLSLSWAIAFITMFIRKYVASTEPEQRSFRRFMAEKQLTPRGDISNYALIPGLALMLLLLAAWTTAGIINTKTMLQLSYAGEVILQPAQVEKLGMVHDFRSKTHRGKDQVGRCYTTIRYTIAYLPPVRTCLQAKLYRSLKPGDGLMLRFVIHDGAYRLDLARLPAAEMPAAPELNSRYPPLMLEILKAQART